MYDALNVLMAMNIISKEKKEIKWIGLPTNSAQECQNLEVPLAQSFQVSPHVTSVASFVCKYYSCVDGRWSDRGGWKGSNRNSRSFRSSYYR